MSKKCLFGEGLPSATQKAGLETAIVLTQKASAPGPINPLAYKNFPALSTNRTKEAGREGAECLAGSLWWGGSGL